MNTSVLEIGHQAATGNATTVSKNSTVLLFTRSKIEAEDFSPVVFFLLNNASNSKSVRQLKNCVSIKITGYENESQELWEILSVQRYIKKILGMWTEWMYFLNLNDATLLLCILCLAGAKKDHGSQKITLLHDAFLQIIDAFDGMQGLFDSQGLEQKDKPQIENAVTQYLCQHLSPRLS